jgi:hypothetical protein
MKLDRRYFSGHLWARKLINLLWRTIHTQWDHRNADRHGHTKATNHTIHHECQLCQLQDQYRVRPIMLAKERGLLAKPIQTKMKKSPGAMKLWFKQKRSLVKL